MDAELSDDTRNYLKDEDVFKMIIQFDPTYKVGANTVGDYGEWLLQRYLAGDAPLYARVETSLKHLSDAKKYKIPNVNYDIFSYKSTNDLVNALYSSDVED